MGGAPQAAAALPPAHLYSKAMPSALPVRHAPLRAKVIFPADLQGELRRHAHRVAQHQPRPALGLVADHAFHGAITLV